MRNGNQTDTKEYNSELIDCIKNVAKEMAHSLIKTKYNNDVVSTEHTSGQRSDIRRSILDIELPENVLQTENRNKPKNNPDNTNNKDINVVIFDKTDSLVNNDFNDLFNDDYNFKIVKTSMNKNLYEREMEGKLKKEKKLEMLRNKKKEENLSHIKNRLKINKLSQKINEKKQIDIKPIQNRAKEIEDKKYLKIDKLKQIYREIAETECSKITSSTQYDEKKFDDWLCKQSKWESNKKIKIETAKHENERLETENMKSMYHPNIDKKSEILMRSKVLTSESSKNKESVYDKLYNLKDDKYNKINQRLVDSIPTFTPIINKHIPDFNKAKFYKRNNETKINETNDNRHRNHFNSVEFRNNYDVIDEESYRNEGNYGSSKNKGLNTSMINQYYNPLKQDNAEIGEEEVPDLISRYRESFEMNDNTDNINKNTATKGNKKCLNRSYQEENNEQKWQDSIVNINKKQPIEPKNDLNNNNLLYKINVRNGPAWDQNKENCIIYNPKITNIKTSLTKHSAK